MKTQITIENCPQPFCVIHTQEESPQIQEIAQKIRLMDESGKNTLIPAWDGDYCLQLKPQKIFRIYSMDKKVFVESEKESLLLKMRLYEFEDLAEKCGWTDFIRISNTDIANFSKVTALDMSISGQVKVNFTNGKTAMVSRRYMKKIRDLLNLVRK